MGAKGAKSARGDCLVSRRRGGRPGRRDLGTGGRGGCAVPVALTPQCSPTSVFRKDHRKFEVLDVVEFLVETGEEAEFCFLG